MTGEVIEARPDREPLTFDVGHPWHGRRLLPAFVRSRDERGRVVLSWRPHMPEAWPPDERGEGPGRP